MKTAHDSYTITIKQIVRFQERMMHFEKFQVDKIQEGCLYTFINNNTPHGEQRWTILIRQL